MAESKNEIWSILQEAWALRERENIKRRILSGQHARRNKEIYLAKQDGKSSKELAEVYKLHPSYISMLCRTYKIFLEDNEMPDFDNKVFDGENGTTTLSELNTAKRVLGLVGERLFYESYDIVHALPAPVRAKNALLNEGWNTLAKIERESDASLLRMPNFGRKSLKELRQAISKIKNELGIEGVSDDLIQKTQQKIKEIVYAFGEERGREILSETWAQVRDEARTELQRDIKDLLENIAPHKTPFSFDRSMVENNLYEWNTEGM
jgi:DNA-binding CsgD family transcriptional regulator